MMAAPQGDPVVVGHGDDVVRVSFPHEKTHHTGALGGSGVGSKDAASFKSARC